MEHHGGRARRACNAHERLAMRDVEGRESGMESPSARSLRNADDAASHPVIAENQTPDPEKPKA